MASQYLLQEIEDTYQGRQVPTQAPPVPEVAPENQPTPSPAPQPSILNKAKRVATGGLGLVGKALSLPSEMTEKVLTGGKGYEAAGWGLASTPARFVLDPLNLAGGLGAASKVAKAGKLAGLAAGLTKAQKLSSVGTYTTRAGRLIAKSKPVAKAMEYARKTPALYKPIEAVGSRYFRNPEAGKIIEEAKKTSLLKVNKLYQQVAEAAKGLSRAQQARIGQLLEGGVTTLPKDNRMVQIAEQFRGLGEQIGKQAVEEGLLDPEAYSKLKGKYMSHIWNEISQGKDVFGRTSDVPTISGQFFKKRKGAQGYVREFAAPVFKGLGTEIKDIEAARMYKNIARRFGVKEPISTNDLSELASKGYQYVDDLSESRGGKILDKTLLPKEVVDYLRENVPKQEGGRLFQRGLRAWKAGKTIHNPAYHVRNAISNQFLTEAATGEGLPKTVVNAIRYALNYAGKGKQQFVKEASEAGLINKKYFGEAVDEFLNQGFSRKGKLAKALDAPKKLQQAAEDSAKLSVFAYFRKQGLSVEEAAKKAEEAIFSPYNLSAKEKGILGSIFPFYSFTRQAAPFIGKKLITNPERFTKYPKIEQAIERASEAPDEANMANWQKGMVRTPFKTKEGQSKYLNLRYLYPWGSFLNEEGTPNMTLGLGFNPLAEEVAAQAFNTDRYFDREIASEGETKSEQLKTRAGHVANTFLPAAYRSVAGKIIPSLRGRPDYAGRERGKLETIAGELTGFRLYPYDPRQGARNKAYLRYQIEEDYKSLKNKYVKDKSLSPEERIRKINALEKRKRQRLEELSK